VRVANPFKFSGRFVRSEARTNLAFICHGIALSYSYLQALSQSGGFDKGKEIEIGCNHNGEGKQDKGSGTIRLASNRMFLLFENSIVCHVC